MVWDFGEMNPFAESAGDFGEAIEYLAKLIEHVAASARELGSSEEADAAASPMADDSGDLFFTDPPYYDAIP
jgi:adenine-specific DNA methylase